MTALAARAHLATSQGLVRTATCSPIPSSTSPACPCPSTRGTSVVVRVFMAWHLRHGAGTHLRLFLTDIEIQNASEDETDKWQPFLTKKLRGLSVVQDMLRNRSCYGNAFASVVVPFRRWLHCPQCSGAGLCTRSMTTKRSRSPGRCPGSWPRVQRAKWVEVFVVLFASTIAQTTTKILFA